LLNNQTIEGLHTLRLVAMAAGLAEQCERADYQALSFEERLGMLVDREIAERENRRLERCLKQAKLRTNAVVEDIDFRRRRGLERPQVLALAEAGFVRSHHNIAIVGPTGVGKTYLACALANSAMRHGHTAMYLRSPRMLDDLAIARVDGRFQRLMASWARIDVLVIDDFLLRPLSSDQAADTLEVIEDRAGLRSTILTSQLPVSLWHEALGEATIADALLDRVLENLHRIELEGESMRRSENADEESARSDRPKRRRAPAAESDA
jgi:DNA replication protein DnaC